jgi:Flp pilus assembly protein TadG
MWRSEPGKKERARGFLSALARDTRANTLAMMAMFLIPLSGLVGSAVDMSRLYVVKARLQQACDAGALAGRKAMLDTGTTLDDNAVAQANAFFGNNFKRDVTSTNTKGFMGTTAVTFVPTKTTDSQVAATSSAAVPMTITKLFGINATTVSVVCQARYDVADTDIMFVLDTTGSMACLPSDSDTTCSNYAGAASKVEYTRTAASGGVAGYAGTVGIGTTEKSGSRIEALRQAVLSFYDTFAASADPSTKVRYGFVTYSSVVNAGKAIMDVSPSFMVGGTGSEMRSYQSRQVYADSVSATNTNSTNNGKNSGSCNASVRTPTTAKTYSPTSYTIPAATGASAGTGAAGTASRVYDYWNSGTNRCQTRTDTLIPQWQYQSVSYDVNTVIQGQSVTDPTKVRGQTTQWIGCVETPVETAGQSSFTTTSLPAELNPDLSPSGAQRWWPHMSDVVYARNLWTSANSDTTIGDLAYDAANYGVDPYMPSQTVSSGRNSTTTYTNTWLRNAGYTTCGKPVKRLGVMARTDIYNYVYANDFVAMGGTYHDTGMIWGTRLIAPNGPWGADTAAWQNRNTPNRVIIFLTDGDMAPNSDVYGMYGIEAFDARVSGSTSASTATLTTLHNARFLAECAAAKARNIDVWTVSIDTAANAQLTACASSTSQALATTDGTGLSTAFASIAKRLAMLRITK